MRALSILAGVALLALSACGSSPDTQNNAPSSAPDAASAGALPTNEALRSQSVPAGPAATEAAKKTLVSCSSEIGQAAAAQLVKRCFDASPATHPPCNAANSCAMMQAEIARSCALFDGKGEPMKGCSPDPKSTAAAVAVVKLYYAAINAHDYDTAWLQWGDNGPAGQTMATFEAGFAHTRATKVTIGVLKPGDGAAGSSYQPVPVTVEAELDDGTRQRFTGDYVIRRVNDVDGAAPGDLRWHIDSAHLKAG